MFLAKSGHSYVKSVGGKPSFRSTQNLSEAARFETVGAAEEGAANVFSGSMLAALWVVLESSPAAGLGRQARTTAAERFNDEPNHPGEGYMGR